jgi:hypothetical protein
MILAAIWYSIRNLPRVIAIIVIRIIIIIHREILELCACTKLGKASSAVVGQHPQELDCVGIVLADATATAETLIRLLMRLIVDLKGKGTSRIVIHDTFEKLGADHDSTLAALHHHGLNMVYTTPVSTLKDWKQIWTAPILQVDGGLGLGGAPAASAAYKDFITKHLAEVLGADSADGPLLLLVIGPILCSAGFPPWHTRFCEIRHLGPAKYAAVHMHDALQQFQNTWLRFGT